MTAEDEVNVLLVDDRPANLVALEAILEAPGRRLIKATSGEEALSVALREDLAVILLDVRMPGMDGLQVAAHLKGVSRTRYVPIIFVTAVATEVQHIYKAYSVGAVDYLIKPLDTDVVRRKVATFVELFQQRREIERQAAALRETERREHELRLAELRMASDTRYRKFVEGIDHVIAWSADPTTLQLSFVSRQAEVVLGSPLAQLSRPDFWLRHLHPDDRDAFLACVRETAAMGTDRTCNHRMLAADGRELWFHTGLSLEAPLGATTPELHGVSTDVTDLKLAEQEAQEATRAREELLAVVSHDLKTPLQVIGLSAERLLRLAPGADVVAQASQAATSIVRAASRMNRLLEDLLDLDRIEHARLELERGPHDARDLVQDGVELVAPIATERKVSLRVDAAGSYEHYGKSFEAALALRYLAVVRTLAYVKPVATSETEFEGGAAKFEVFLIDTQDKTVKASFAVEASSKPSVEYMYQEGKDDKKERLAAFARSTLWEDAREKIAAGLKTHGGATVVFD
jgi:CheY-like chemotaxis protein